MSDPVQWRSSPTLCPCGEPATHQLWEAKLPICEAHAREWLRSPEKLRCTVGRDGGGAGGGDWHPGDAVDDVAMKTAVDDFVVRITRDRPSAMAIVRAALGGVRRVIEDAYAQWKSGRRS